MTTLYRIKFKVVEPKREMAGERVVEMPLERYIETLRRNHPEASSIYMELVSQWDVEDESISEESIIIMG